MLSPKGSNLSKHTIHFFRIMLIFDESKMNPSLVATLFINTTMK